MSVAFADCEIDFERVELRRAGTVVPVQPQVFAVIEYLVNHRERVVPKGELLDQVWGDRFVSESALTSRIKSARRAIGDDGATQRLIRTVQGRGYRFVADVGAPNALVDGASVARRPVPEPETTHVGTGWPLLGRGDAVHTLVRVATSVEWSGAIVAGPDRVGKSSVVAAAARSLIDDGVAVVRARGVGADVPLSGLGPILPGDVVAELARSSSDDLAKFELWQRARAALVGLGDAGTVIVFDDLDRIDSLSASLLVSLVDDHRIRLLAATRRPGPTSDITRLVENGLLTRVELAPLDEADVDALLYRRLGGSVDLATLHELHQVTGGLPGVLVDVVEASLDAERLRLVDGVWRLVGSPISHEAGAWPPPELSDHGRSGAQRLALLEQVLLTDADEHLGVGTIDDLDAARLIAIDDSPYGTVVRLADPTIVEAVIGSIPPVRLHRLRAELAVVASGGDRHPPLVAAAVRWPAGHELLGVEQRVRVATSALRYGDVRSASILVEGLDTSDDGVAVVAAELAAMRGQYELAERLLDAIDPERLVDDQMMTIALRRRASIAATQRGRHDLVIADLTASSGGLGGQVGEGLVALTLTLLAQVHRYEEVLRIGPSVSFVDPVARAEVLIAQAFALAGSGRFHASNQLLEEVDRLAATMPTTLAAEMNDTAIVLATSSAQQLGDLQRASDLRRRHIPAGRVMRFGFAPLIAADIELSAGRARSAREILRPVRSMQVRNLYPQFEAPLEALSARVAVALGDVDAAHLHVDRAFDVLPRSFGAAQARASAWIADACVSLSRPVADLELAERADSAEATGATLSSMEARCAAVIADPSPATARHHLAHVESAVPTFDGDLWPLRLDHVRARAEQRPLTTIAERYRELGFEHLARRADEGR